MPHADAADDFARVRRRAAFARLMGMLGGTEEDSSPLTFAEMLDALGQRGQRMDGVQAIPLDEVRGSVDRARDFDAAWRPRSGRSRARWERVAEAVRRGIELPPIDVYRIAGSYFVEDGHHRVSVAKAQGHATIDAVVTRIVTAGPGRTVTSRQDLELGRYERILDERLPLPAELVPHLQVDDPRSFAVLAETIEAWAARTMLAEGRLMARDEIVPRFYVEELCVAADLLRDAGLMRPDERLVEAYLRISCERYWLTRCHQWDEDVVAALLAAH